MAAALAALAIFLAACKSAPTPDPPDALASPQAKAEPAPLANPMSSGPITVTPNPDAGPPPVPLRADREIPVDTPKEPSREPPPIPTAGKDGGVVLVPVKKTGELSGFALQAVLRTTEGASPPKSPEVSTAGLDAARRKTDARLTIELSQTRAKITLSSNGFVLPAETELRARLDRYGHIVILPNDSGHYRIAAPGALRALLGERRLDVAPLSQAQVTVVGDGAKRANLTTRKVEVTTRAAKGTFELATLKDAGDGGVLLCRALLDLMSAPPSTPLCTTDQIPLHAELRWATKGALVFDVVSLTKRHDFPVGELAAPPANVTFVTTPPPADASEILLTKSELAAIRTMPVEALVASASDAQAPPENGLLLVNASDELRIATLDGVPVAWLAPGAREVLTSLLHGRYVLQWRTFLGDSFEPPQTVTVPGTTELPDAG